MAVRAAAKGGLLSLDAIILVSMIAVLVLGIPIASRMGRMGDTATATDTAELIRPLVESQNKALQDRDAEIRTLKSELQMLSEDIEKLRRQYDQVVADLAREKAERQHEREVLQARVSVLENQLRSRGDKPLTEVL